MYLFTLFSSNVISFIFYVFIIFWNTNSFIYFSNRTFIIWPILLNATGLFLIGEVLNYLYILFIKLIICYSFLIKLKIFELFGNCNLTWYEVLHLSVSLSKKYWLLIKVWIKSTAYSSFWQITWLFFI